jgi:DNA polymerase (family 10)
LVLTNKEISKLLKLFTDLLDLHNENAFKVKAYTNASFQIGKYAQSLSDLSVSDIEIIPGVGKKLAAQVHQISQEGTCEEFENVLTATPTGILDMLSIKGLGSSKVKTLWKEHAIDDIDKLLIECQSQRLSSIKGFGEKTAQSILEAILFKKQNEQKILYSKAELLVHTILESALQKGITLVATGDFYRKEQTIEKLEFVVVEHQELNVFIEEIKSTLHLFPVEFHRIASDQELHSTLFKTSALEGFLAHFPVLNVTDSQEDIFQKNQRPYIIPEMRNGLHEWDWSAKYTIDNIIQYQDLTGALHNHSKYSDGEHTIQQMAQECMRLGYQYFGIADHSKTATYAGGLTEHEIALQHQEIDALNAQNPSFRILKGIESDILGDGSLDYSNDILQTFDYVVASVHSVLNMSKERATSRLLKAIENPYTTILGHPTGRLLLKRKGYEVDFGMIFDACIQNKVVIEINANPWRLDLDWRLIYQAMEKGCLFSINPDAHKIEGISDMQYGVHVARKAGLLKDRVINSFELDRLLNVFQKDIA